MRTQRYPVGLWPTVAITGIFAGCSDDRFRENPEQVKAAQLASLSKAGPNEIAGQPMKTFFRVRTGNVIPQSNITWSRSNAGEIESFDPITHSGRAAALTEDGYFLTAAHVVETEPALIARGFKLYRGRIVKTFPRVDLAIVKFPVRMIEYFDRWADMPARGELVFSSAPHGLHPFEVKGRVRARGRTRDGDSYWTECDLPSLEGSSGTPVANANGELVGVIVAGLHSKITARTLATEVRMLAASTIKEIVERDREAAIGTR